MNLVKNPGADHPLANAGNTDPTDGHLCFVFEAEGEHRAYISQYLHEGLEQGEKIIYLADASTMENLRDYLSDKEDVDAYFASGQLRVIPGRDAYLSGGFFDPDRMMALLENEVELALSEGYLALRVASEMSWALTKVPGCERLIEFETRLNKFARTHKCKFLCQYDRKCFSPSVLMYVILAHPFVEVGADVYKSIYYGTTPSFLVDEDASAALGRCLKRLVVESSDERTSCCNG